MKVNILIIIYFLCNLSATYASDLWGRIHTQPGVCVMEERYVSLETFPLKYRIVGDLPKGYVHLFAAYQAGPDWYMAIPGTNESSVAKVKKPWWNNWKVMWFKAYKDEYKPYGYIKSNYENLLTFRVYETITPDMISTYDIRSLAFWGAPAWAVTRYQDFSRSHFVWVKLKR